MGVSFGIPRISRGGLIIEGLYTCKFLVLDIS